MFLVPTTIAIVSQKSLYLESITLSHPPHSHVSKRFLSRKSTYLHTIVMQLSSIEYLAFHCSLKYISLNVFLNFKLKTLKKVLRNSILAESDV